jgi:Predicted permease, DMT superfamily
LGLTGIFLHNVLMYEGLEYISASTASLIFAFIVVQVAIIDSIINKKMPEKRSIVGMFFSVIGILIVVTDGQIFTLPREELGWGAVLIFGSAFSWAVYTVVSRKALKTYSPLIVTTYASGVGLILVAPFPLSYMEESIEIFSDAQSLLFLMFLGVVSSAITFIWHQQALAKIGALSTSIYLNLVPIFGILSAAIILGENLNGFVLVGGFLVFFGIILVNTAPVSVDQ